jgi:hypothetical protein
MKLVILAAGCRQLIAGSGRPPRKPAGTRPGLPGPVDLYAGNDSSCGGAWQGADSAACKAQESSPGKGRDRGDLAMQPARTMPERGLDRDGAPANLWSAQCSPARNGLTRSAAA